MQQDLLNVSSVGADGMITSNARFFKYAKIGGNKKTLLLYDGHRSHITQQLVKVADRQFRFRLERSLYRPICKFHFYKLYCAYL